MSNLLDVTEKQLLRGRILKLCSDAQPLGAGMEVITAALKKEGNDITKQDVVIACFYLKEKNLIKINEVKNEVLGISRQIAEITPCGIDVLEGTRIDGVELI